MQTAKSPRSRRSQPRTFRWWAPLAVLPLLLASCVSGEDGDASSENGDDPPAVPGTEDGGGGEALASSVTTSTEIGADLRVDIESLDRVSDDMVVLSFSFHNVGLDSVNTIFLFSDNGTQYSGHHVTLVDTAGMKRYYPLEDTEGECYCGTWDQNNLSAGESIESWVAFPAPPTETDTISVHTPVTAPFTTIPITGGDGPELYQADLAEPIVLDVQNLTEDLDSGTGRDESGDSVAISLAADVLFDVNESTLTGEAQAILEEVAAEIDEADATAIQIDGYTDSTGNDAINQPLSEDRAEAVREALEDLVTRSGVSYETAGHGSADPIGDNDTDEGRQQNRRVTVTIAQ